jgi:hypothetical protein
MPSLSKSSAAMRSSPHVRFALAIAAISCCTSAGMRGRPSGRDFQRQNSRKASRCQRTSVSGLHNRQQRRPVNESREHHKREPRGVGGAAGLRLAFDEQGQLFAQKQVLAGKPLVRVQGGPEKLKDIEEHIDHRDDHRTMIAPEHAPCGTAAGQSKGDAIFADHRVQRQLNPSQSINFGQLRHNPRHSSSRNAGGETCCGRQRAFQPA